MPRVLDRSSGPGDVQLLKVMIGNKTFYAPLQSHIAGRSNDQPAAIVGTIKANSGTPYIKYIDLSDGSEWFVNTKTGESVWTLPEDGLITKIEYDGGKGGKRYRHATRKGRAKKSKRTRRMKGGGMFNLIRLTEKTSKKISNSIDMYLDVIGNPDVQNQTNPENDRNTWIYIYQKLKKKCYFGETLNCEIKFLNDKVQAFNVFDKYILMYKGKDQEAELIRRINFLRERFPAIKVLFDYYLSLKYDATFTSNFTDLNPSALTPEILATLEHKPAKQ